MPAALTVSAGIPRKSTAAPIAADTALRKLNLSRSIGLVPPHHRAHRAEFASPSAADTTDRSRRWHRSIRDRCQSVAALLAAVTGLPTDRVILWGAGPRPADPRPASAAPNGRPAAPSSIPVGARRPRRSGNE